MFVMSPPDRLILGVIRPILASISVFRPSRSLNTSVAGPGSILVIFEVVKLSSANALSGLSVVVMNNRKSRICFIVLHFASRIFCFRNLEKRWEVISRIKCNANWYKACCRSDCLILDTWSPEYGKV